MSMCSDSKQERRNMVPLSSAGCAAPESHLPYFESNFYVGMLLFLEKCGVGEKSAAQKSKQALNTFTHPVLEATGMIFSSPMSKVSGCEETSCTRHRVSSGISLVIRFFQLLRKFHKCFQLPEIGTGHLFSHPISLGIC